jgi:cellulose synthase/poly-beta-1,6-N-acetylglucosamine synthase-like glycosyltransferase
MNIALFIFLLSIIIIIYIYFGYPLLIYLIALLSKGTKKKTGYQPLISILISAYNEQLDIESTIRNKLELNYPKSKLELIIVSDGSEDETDSIIKKYVNSGVIYLNQQPRQGKTAALNLAATKAKGEILVFSDANSIYDFDAIKELVKNFINPKVGYVTGKMIYINENGTLVGDGCSAYMKYENFLRENETKIGSIVGVDGGIDAIRKELYVNMNADQQPDFLLPLHVISKGYKVIYEPKAILKEKVLSKPVDEYSMRVRVSLRALWILKDKVELFNIFKYKLFSIQLFSHKLLRYFTFFFMLLSFITNLILISEHFIFQVILLLQLIFYTSGILVHFLNKKYNLYKILSIPYYFLLINLAAAHAAMQFLIGKKQVIWNPRKGI